MIEVEVVKFDRETNNALDKKVMLLTEWNVISKQKYSDCYFKAYQLGYSQFFNK
jgi:hypothetical protein